MRKMLICTAIWTVALLAAERALDQELQRAIDLMETKGDLAGATRLFEEVARGRDRAVAARALLYLGQCHERQGAEKARATYQRIERDFSEQREMVAEARRRVAALGAEQKPAGGLTARQLFTGDVDTSGSISADGQVVVMTHWDSGDVAIRDLASGQTRRLNLKTSWTESTDFAQGPVFSRDQRQIAYAWYSDHDRKYQLRTVSARPGAKPRVLVRNPEVEYIQVGDWTPDGKSILAGLWRTDGTSQIAWVSAADGTVKVLKSVEWRSPDRMVLSPDGRYVAYDVRQRPDSADRDIYILGADGSREGRLVDGGGHDAAPTWSPDGSRIVFLSDRSGRMDLWSLELRDGKPLGAPQILKTDIGSILPLGFTRGGALYYVHDRGDEDIFSLEMDPVSGKPRGAPARLVQSFVGQNTRPSWSPDGAYVAYHSHRGHARYGPGAVSLVVRSVATGEEKVFLPKVTLGQRAVWYHNKAAVLETGRDGQDRVSFYRADPGTGRLDLVQNAGAGITRSSAFALAPDDTTVYAPFLDEGSEDGGVARMNLRTGEQTRIYTVSGGYVTGLSLSPDGRSLALMLNTRDGDKPGQRVAVIGVDGTGFRQLTEPGVQGTLVPVLGLEWSPDGRWIYFVKVKQPESELWRVPAAGGAAESTGISAKEMKHIHLSADGARLAFTAGQRANPELWVLENVLPTLRSSR